MQKREYLDTIENLKLENLTYLSCHARRAAHCDAPPSLSSAATAARRWDTRPTHFLLHWCCSYDLLLLDLYTPTAEIKRPAPDFKYATMPGMKKCFLFMPVRLSLRYARCVPPLPSRLL